MVSNIYCLPQIEFVGGETRRFLFKLFTENNVPFDASGGSGNFALLNYSNKTGAVILSKTCTFKSDENGIESIVEVQLNSAETLALYGKYIYQLTIRDIEGNVEIPGQGIIIISKNINQSFL